MDTRPASEIAFERLSLKREEEYVDFLMDAYREHFNSRKFSDRELVKRSWRWEYVDNPAAAGQDPYIWICRRKGRIMAQACFMPVRVKIKGSEYKGCWCQDLMVRPEFRNMGMGYFLVRHALGELTGNMDLCMVSGTNPASAAILKGIGFIDLGFIDRNVKLALFGNAARKQDEGKDSVNIRELKYFDERFDHLWNEVSERYSCITIRDKKALEWRFNQNPYLKYSILVAEKNSALRGYIILRKDKLKRGILTGFKIGVISDMFFNTSEKDVGISLLNKAFQVSGKDTKLFRCDFLSKAIKPIVGLAGFRSIKSDNRFLAYPINRVLAEAATDRSEWYLTYGDSDLDLS